MIEQGAIALLKEAEKSAFKEYRPERL